MSRFKDAVTEAVFNQSRPKGFPADLFRSARRKLEAVYAATSLEDLKLPPGNRLEALTGDRKGQLSIRVNSQYRVCFVWAGTQAERIEIVDYH